MCILIFLPSRKILMHEMKWYNKWYYLARVHETRITRRKREHIIPFFQDS